MVTLEMTTAPTADLQALLSQPPANFVWSSSADGRRTLGTAPGAMIDLWPDRVELVAIFPPDDLALAQHNGALLLLVLCALRPAWEGVPAWLKVQLDLAKRAKVLHEGTHYGQRVTFIYERRYSRATLKVQR